MKRISTIILAMAACLPAQQASTPDYVAKMIPVHYVDVDRLDDLLRMNGVNIRADAGLHVLVVSGRPDVVAAIEEMVKKLDVPPPAQREFELTGYLVSGSIQQRADEIPADLAPAVKQLHNLFNYKSYRVMDIFFIHAGPSGRGGEPFRNQSTSGILPGTNSQYDFAYNDANVTGTTVHLSELRLTIMTPTSERNAKGAPISRNVGIHTSVDVPEGQRIVVGKSSVPGGDDCLILVLSVKLLK